MSMSWTAALHAQDDSLEAMLARREQAQKQELGIADTMENMRHTRVAEDQAKQALAEQVAWREANQKTLDAQRQALIDDKNDKLAESQKHDLAKQAFLADPENEKRNPNLWNALQFENAGIKPAAGVQTGLDAGAAMDRTVTNNTAAMERVVKTLAQRDRAVAARKSGGGKGANLHVKAYELALRELGPDADTEDINDRAGEIETQLSAAAGTRIAKSSPGDIDLSPGVKTPGSRTPAVIQKADPALTQKAAAILQSKGYPTDDASVATFIKNNKGKF